MSLEHLRIFADSDSTAVFVVAVAVALAAPAIITRRFSPVAVASIAIFFILFTGLFLRN